MKRVLWKFVLMVVFVGVAIASAGCGKEDQGAGSAAKDDSAAAVADIEAALAKATEGEGPILALTKCVNDFAGSSKVEKIKFACSNVLTKSIEAVEAFKKKDKAHPGVAKLCESLPKAGEIFGNTSTKFAVDLLCKAAK